jgi:type IV pilus assembly protein PilM
MAKYVKRLCENPKYGKITGKRVSAAIPEAYIFTRVLELPAMGNKEMEEAVKYDAEQYIPISINDLYLDYQVLGPALSGKENALDICLVATPKAIVDSYLKLFDALNWEVNTIETNLSSIARAVIPQKEKDEVAVLLDIGGQRTNLAVFDHNIRVTGSFPKGGVDFTTAIADKLKINILKAEELKNHKGFNGEDGAVGTILEPMMLEIVEQTEKIIKYYTERAANVKLEVSKIVICGGNASVPGLIEFISKQLKINAVMGNPWANISIYPLKPVPKLEAPMYTAAIGLAQKGI